MFWTHRSLRFLAWLRLAMFQLGLSLAVLLLAMMYARGRPGHSNELLHQELAGSRSDTS